MTAKKKSQIAQNKRALIFPRILQKQKGCTFKALFLKIMSLPGQRLHRLKARCRQYYLSFVSLFCSLKKKILKESRKNNLKQMTAKKLNRNSSIFCLAKENNTVEKNVCECLCIGLAMCSLFFATNRSLVA